MVYEFGTLYKLLASCALFCRSSFFLWTVYPLVVSLFVFCHLRLLNTSYVSSDLSDRQISDNFYGDREYIPTIPT